MKAIAGIARPRKGSISMEGQNLAGERPDTIARAGIGYVPEDRQVFSMHSVEDNLLIGMKKGVRGQEDWTLERVYDTFPILARMKDRKAGLMSGGEQQMLTIARTLMGNPDVLLLDEPSEGLRSDHRAGDRRSDPHPARHRRHHRPGRAEHAFPASASPRTRR